MRILYIGNFNEKHNGANYYDSNRRLANGFVRNGHHVYQFSDRDVARTSTWFGSRKFGVLPSNVKLLTTARQLSPDLIVIGHSDVIFTKTLWEIRKSLPYVKIAFRNVDALWHQDNVDRMMKRVEVVDSIFVTTTGPLLKQFARKNNVVSFFPNIVDKSVDSFRAFEKVSPEHRLFYGMGNAEPGSERYNVSNRLLDHFPNEQLNIRGIRGTPPIGGFQYQTMLGNARMGLNLSRGEGPDVPLYASDRMAHYTGNGLLTLTHRRTGFDSLYSEDELAFYDDFDDLIKKIEYFNLHDNEAREIAENGWRRSHEIFNDRLVAKYIEEVTFRRPLSEDYQWPTELHTI